MNKSTKKLQFSKKTKDKIMSRDKECIFCRNAYHMESTTLLGYQLADIMHVVNKSQGGLGVEQNGVLGCRYHHQLLDNGNEGIREEMKEMLITYLKELYPNWDMNQLYYKKFNF